MFSLLAFPLACSHAPPETAPVLPPAPMPRTRTVASSWHVPRWTGSSSYRFSRHVVVTSDGVQYKALVFDTVGSETFVQASRPNTLTVAADGAKPTERLSVTLFDGQLVAAKQDVGLPPCDASSNPLRSDLFDLAVQLPPTLSAQTAWTDSAVTDMCVGGVPGSARTIRRYTVAGDTIFSDGRAVVLSRRDSTTIAAEGILEQHPTVVSGSAASKVLLYVSESSGRVLRIAKEQTLLLSVSAEGSTKAFVQKLTSAVDLVR